MSKLVNIMTDSSMDEQGAIELIKILENIFPGVKWSIVTDITNMPEEN